MMHSCILVSNLLVVTCSWRAWLNVYVWSSFNILWKWCFLFHRGWATNWYGCIHLICVLNVHTVTLYDNRVAALNYVKMVLNVLLFLREKNYFYYLICCASLDCCVNFTLMYVNLSLFACRLQSQFQKWDHRLIPLWRSCAVYSSTHWLCFNRVLLKNVVLVR